MISIITAIHNQLAMNKLFINSLKRYTLSEYELIIIDNNSTDGSRELFEQQGAKIIRNPQNYSYPYCQNQGIREASGEVLAFFNNDIILSQGWDVRLLDVIGKDGHDVVSFATIDFCRLKRETRKYSCRWKRIKYPLLLLLGRSVFSLRLMFNLMYWKGWNRFTQKMFEKHHYEMQQGFSGSVIAMTRQGLDKIGFWDERIQSADWDTYARCRQRHAEVGDIKPLCIISGIYIHHYQRLTLKSSRKPIVFADQKNMMSFDDKWGKGFADHIISKEIDAQQL